MTVLSNLFALLLVLCILVLLHEWGHFFTARLFGIRPYIFSFGIGWRLIGFQKRGGRWRVAFGPPREWAPPGPDTGTDFRISMIPFGGYVMLQGESLSEAVTGDAQEFRTRPRWQQFIVYGAGVTLNIILAWVLVTGLYIHKGFAPSDETGPLVVGTVQKRSGAEKAGLRAGDKILQIEGRDATDPMVLTEEILYAPNTTKTLLVERDGTQTTIQLPIGMDPKYHIGLPDFSFRGINPMISDVAPGQPAGLAGLAQGDVIVGVNGRPDPTSEEVQEIIKSTENQPVRLEVDRDGERKTIEVTPVKMDDGVRRIGIVFGHGRRVGIAGAAVEGARYCRDNATLLFLTIKHLVRMDISARVLSGPIEIAKASGDSLRTGPAAFILLLAFVSIQLGVINLFPIPGLDGGHMLILIVEGIFRRELPERVKQWVVTTGFAMLLLFAVVVMYYDVVKARTPAPAPVAAPSGETQGTP
jgi:regulator of sigma E protease